jgi:hypothetical protein
MLLTFVYEKIMNKHKTFVHEKLMVFVSIVGY